MEILMNFLCPYIYIGSEGMLLEGIRRVFKWGDECIELSAWGKIIVIGGKGLRMEHKSLDSLLIKGEIKTIEFLKKDRGERQ